MLGRGQRIEGKWTDTTFYVERMLGEGANGQVYLVHTPRGKAAMKICGGSSDIALEWGVLESLSAVSRVFPAPLLIDDAPPAYYFYVMEWVHGEPLGSIAGILTPEVTHQTVLQLLGALDVLHSRGYAFCDMKPENVLVAVQPQLSVRFVDVGGVTPFGRSVRQYTPFFDRGFWGLGTRKSDPAYDLCAAALTILFARKQPPDSLYSRTPDDRRQWLAKWLHNYPLPQYQLALEKALTGQYASARDFMDEWQAAPRASIVAAAAGTGAGIRPAPHTPSRSRRSVHPRTSRRRRWDWTEWLMWTSLGTAATVTFAAWATFLGWL